MQVVEIKNNLIKLLYNPVEENLTLSGFVIVRDNSQAFIGQVINLETQEDQNVAMIKLMFTFDEQGVISNYNGSIPSLQCQVNSVFARELLELFAVEKPIYLGQVAQQSEDLVLDKSLFDQKSVICIEKQEERDILQENLLKQLAAHGNKILVIDTAGDLKYPNKTLVAGKDFKLPLDYDTINFIYEKGLDDASGETKATIQEVFLEVQNYVKTLPEKFLPFETFKSVVDAQYQELELVELLLLKNKLLKYYDEGVFAQEETDFKSLEFHLAAEDITVLDISEMSEAVQREMMAFAYSAIEVQGEPVYVLINVDNDNTDKKLLKKIYSTKNAISIISCQYSFKYVKELKQLSKNVLMFAPIQQQSDFGGYNIFLNKLNHKEFVIYGESTHHIPFIVTLKELPEKYYDIIAESKAKAQEETIAEAPQMQAEEEIPAVQPEPKEQEFTPEPAPAIEPEDVSGTFSEYTDNTEVEPVAETSEINLAEEETEESVFDSAEEQEEIPAPMPEDALVEQIKKDVDEIYTAPQMQQEEPPAEQYTDADLDFIQENLPQEVLNAETFEPLQEEPVSEMQQPLPQTETNEEGSISFDEVMEQQAQSEPSAESAESEILPQEAASTPIVPVYAAETEAPVPVQSDDVQQGDVVMHAKHGRGVVEKLISYGDKTLCSINFDNVGRRLLDPNVTEIKKA